MKMRPVQKIISCSLLIVTILLFLSGFGITYPQVITPLTLGLLGKAESFRLHVVLWGPFLILLLLHIYVFMVPRKDQ